MATPWLGPTTPRPPRVRVRANTDILDGTIELPFVLGVMADFSGGAAASLPPVGEREFLEVSIDNLDERMRAVRPRVQLRVPNVMNGGGELSLDLTFESLNGFLPAAIARQIGCLGPAAAGVVQIDGRMSRQIDEIIHHPAFQAIEATWRGLCHLVENTETGADLMIRMLDVSKSELPQAIGQSEGTADGQGSPLHQKLLAEYTILGGQPYGCLIGDYAFDHGAPDLTLLHGIARIAAAAHCPFISAAAPSLLKLTAWPALASMQDIGSFTAPEYAGWQALRRLDDARFLVLTMPRFLGRAPHGAQKAPAGELAFDETTGGDPAKHLWLNAAYAMAERLVTSFHRYRWWSRIRGHETGGAMVSPASHAFGDGDGGPQVVGPTELAVAPGAREAALRAAGLAPLTVIWYAPNAVTAAFIEAQSLHATAAPDSDATADALHGARLRHLLAACCFARHLRCLAFAHATTGSRLEPERLRARLQQWLESYVDPDPQASGERATAARPLAAAQVVFETAGDGEQPGDRQARILISPSHQLERLSAPVVLRSTLLVASPPGRGPPQGA